MRTPPNHRVAIVAALASLLAASALALLAPPVRAGTAVVFSEDFETGTIDPRWTRYDNNIASGLDYWDVTTYRARTGSYSAWSAQIGTQAGSGLNNSDVHEYDDDMQADLSIDLQVNGFTSLTLSFYYWSRAESGGGDFIQAWYEAGGSQFLIFPNTGNANWDLASVPVPNNVERLMIRFVADGANHNFEGAYVDDIVLTGTESNAPTSSALALPMYANASPVNVAYLGQDGANESGVAYVELWWRLGTPGNFSLYATPTNPSGQWTASPIPFDPALVAGEGYYEFYTAAMDNAQNGETPPMTADAFTTIDLTPPALTITGPADGAWFQTGSVTVLWQGSDAVSGLNRYETRLDGGGFAGNALTASRGFPGLADGTHTVTVRAYDHAGNMAEDSVTFGVDTVGPTVTITAPGMDSRFTVETVTVRWTASDATSGIDHYEMWLDDGARRTTSDPRWTLTGLGDGHHTVHVVAVDAAGNAQETSVTFGVSTGFFNWDGPNGPLPLLLLLAAILAAILFVFFVWRKRAKDRQKAPREPVSTATEEPATESDEGGQEPSEFE